MYESATVAEATDSRSDRKCRVIPELLNLQNVHGQAKPYQIRQFQRLVERHNLILEEGK
jgi:hypothetical protein